MNVVVAPAAGRWVPRPAVRRARTAC